MKPRLGMVFDLAHKPDMAKFWSLVDKSGECWLWNGTIQSGGYGSFSVRDVSVLAHRLSYESAHGQIPEGKTLDHLCRTRRCVRPRHLEPVTDKENILRGNCPPAINARKNACPSGHEYSGANLIIRNGERFCRACADKYNAERRERRRVQ